MARQAGELDERRQEQIRNQIHTINRLLRTNTMQADFIEEQGLTHEWIKYREAAGCYICGDPRDHDGEPHGIATGDHKTRADHDAEVAATATPSAD
jgi:hypothetical protein